MSFQNIAAMRIRLIDLLWREIEVCQLHFQIPAFAGIRMNHEADLGQRIACWDFHGAMLMHFACDAMPIWGGIVGSMSRFMGLEPDMERRSYRQPSQADHQHSQNNRFSHLHPRNKLNLYGHIVNQPTANRLPTDC